MKFIALRRYIKSKNLQETYLLKNRELVIDGHSFFKNSYKDSGCQFVLGPDCDSYADYLISKLTCFLDCNIKCHVIFKGTSKDDLARTQEKHQIAIDNRNNIKFNLDNPKYFDPLLVHDVQKQVFEEMGIKYFCCEHDSMEAIVGVARSLRCPVLTDNLEYCLFKVSCILPNSITYKEGDKELHCTIYEHHKHQALFGVFIKTPVLLTVLSQNKEFLNKIPELSNCAENDDVQTVIRWVKRLHKDFDVSKNFNDENTSKAYLEMYERMKILYLFPTNNIAVTYFRRAKPYGLFKDDRKWFSKGVCDGRIGLPYVDIKRRGYLSGSKIVNDFNKPDAILAADKIISYNHKYLTNSRKTTLSFIGRKGTSSSNWEIESEWPREINNRELFIKPKLIARGNKKVYSEFFKGVSPGHDIILILLSHTNIPQDCWVLIMTLVYYIDNVNEDFIDGAYFIILSYLLLGPVSKTISTYKEKGEAACSTTQYKAVQKIYDVLGFLFNKVELNVEFNTSLLHSLAEFQHCLQHMNYFNNICGKVNRCVEIPGTVYHDTYNATFIYNAFTIMRNKENLMKYLEEHFNETDEFLKLYKDIIEGLENCRHPTKEMTLDPDETLMLMFSSRPIS